MPFPKNSYPFSPSSSVDMNDNVIILNGIHNLKQLLKTAALKLLIEFAAK